MRIQMPSAGRQLCGNIALCQCLHLICISKDKQLEIWRAGFAAPRIWVPVTSHAAFEVTGGRGGGAVILIAGSASCPHAPSAPSTCRHN